MVWSYPDALPAGVVENRPVLSLDVAATALDLAGLPVDDQLDGRSILSWISDPLRPSPHETIYWRMPGGKFALRRENWKIVRPSANEAIELYHLAGDLGETRNLVSEHPEKMKELINLWNALDAEMAEPIQFSP
jgi:arylsulfatase A-like enzyme